MGTRPGFSSTGPSSSRARPGPGGSRSGPGGRGRPTPGRFASSGSGLDDMSNGSESRDFSRRGASSRRNPSGPGNRGGNQE
jgi:hypothetical protein